MGVFDAEHYPYHVFKGLCTRCMGPDHYKDYGRPVQAYWNQSQSNMFAAMSDVLSNAEKMDNDARANYLTSCCNDMQTKAFHDGNLIFHKVISLQNGNNTSGQPMEIKLNASKYSDVPPVPEGSTGFFDFPFPL